MKWSETNEMGCVAVHGGSYRIYETKVPSECEGSCPNTRNILPELEWYNTMGQETVGEKLSSRAVVKEQGLRDVCLHKRRCTQIET